MKNLDPVVFRELPIIQKIIQDETWLEGERRGCPVLHTDRVVRARVCEVILRIGQELRDTLSQTSGPIMGLPGTGAPAASASNEEQAA